MKSAPHPAHIELRGVRVHNLQNIDLDIKLGQITVVTGVSGSGKSSLAFDTLYAEGQRRYVESFSAYSRRFLERFEKPDADRIDPIPPALAVRQKSGGRSKRATVGTATEIYDALRLLFARVGVIECPTCKRRVERHTPASAQMVLSALKPGTRFLICFRPGVASEGDGGQLADGQPERSSPVAESLRAHLAQAGFTRLIVGTRTVGIAETALGFSPAADLLVVVDRLTVGGNTDERLADSLEAAFRHGAGATVVLVQNVRRGVPPDGRGMSEWRIVDGIEYNVLSFNTRLICPGCCSKFDEPEPCGVTSTSIRRSAPAPYAAGRAIASPTIRRWLYVPPVKDLACAWKPAPSASMASRSLMWRD